MTALQRVHFYFPAWNRCAKAMGWLMRDGRIKADLQAQMTDAAQFGVEHPLSTLIPKLIWEAYQIASREHRAPVPDDLRHACGVVASGQQSAGKMSSKQTSRVVNLFNLLTWPNNLDAVMAWNNPEVDERNAVVAYLSRIGMETAIAEIAANAFGTHAWRGLDLQQLRWLTQQIKPRTRRDHGNCPF